MICPQGKRHKEIRKLKIAVTADCCLDCRHCFIDKRENSAIKPGYARKAVDTLINSPGSEKKLELYGGEALLELPLLEEITGYAADLAHKKRKKLAVWLASNGITLDHRELEFIKRRGIILSISLYGTRKSHDYIRRFPGGGGSFDALKRRLPEVFSALNPLRVTALLCVHPRFSAAAFDDFLGIAASGFKVINIECVHGCNWSGRAMKNFAGALDRITAHVRKEAGRNNFLLLEPVLDLAGRAERGASPCPFFKDLEIFPDGTYSLYPFGFVDMKKHGNAVSVGCAEKGFSARFSDCVPGGPLCRSCIRGYYRIPDMSGGSAAYALRTSVLERFFRSMLGVKAAYARRYLRLAARLSLAYRGCV